jgi:hypothetical protein
MAVRLMASRSQFVISNRRTETNGCPHRVPRRGDLRSTALNLVGRSVYVADGAPRIFRKKRIFGQDLGQA